MNLAGVVILYYPDQSVNENILSYLPALKKLYIFDNSEKAQNSSLSAVISENSKVEYLSYTYNFGIAESLNKVCKMAITQGFDWLLTMDQDSRFENDYLSEYFAKVENFEAQTTVAMFGIQHYYPNTLIADSNDFKQVNMLITSGSLLNLQQFDIVGGFDEKLFIDEVDSEYCFRAIRAGFRIILFEKIMLNHQLGIKKNYRSLKSFAQTPRSLHSPIRIYYMVRNHLYVYAKYKNDFLADLKFSRTALLNRIKNNLLYGEKRFKVLQLIIKAIVDFKKGKMGKITFS